MSLFTIGYESGTSGETLAYEDSKSEPKQGFFGKVQVLTKWIPTEILAIYVPGIALLAGPQQDNNPSLGFTLFVLVFVPIFVVIGAYVTDRLGTRTIVACLLAIVAFVLWSLTVPLNGWLAIDWVADRYDVWVPIVAAVFALALAPVFEKISTPG